MNTTKKLFIPLLACCLALLSSCDYFSYYEFKVHNHAQDTVSIEMTLTYQYGYEKNGEVLIDDDYTRRPKYDRDTLVLLAPGDEFLATISLFNQYLSTSFEEDGVTPFWCYIKSITVGEKSLEPEAWNHESAWKKKHDGHGIYFGETLQFDLYLDDSIY